MPTLLTPDEITATRALIDPLFLDSPLMRHPALDAALGCAVTLKIETLNPIRSFKVRGTEAVLSALTPRPPAVVAASTGKLRPGHSVVGQTAWHRRDDLRAPRRQPPEGGSDAPPGRGGPPREARA